MSSVIGVVIIARHGDREGYYQDPGRFVQSLAPFHPSRNSISPHISFLHTFSSSIYTCANQTQSYAASDTSITPLGSVQTYTSGVGLRARYLEAGSERAIAGISSSRIDLSQVDFKAEYVPPNLSYDSCVSLVTADTFGSTAQQKVK
jgi:prostatic aicd phosphatase